MPDGTRMSNDLPGLPDVAFFSTFSSYLKEFSLQSLLHFGTKKMLKEAIL
jgi:hypothetical protein